MRALHTFHVGRTASTLTDRCPGADTGILERGGGGGGGGGGGPTRIINRGRVREGDVPPPSRSAEAFEGSSSRT